MTAQGPGPPGVSRRLVVLSGLGLTALAGTGAILSMLRSESHPMSPFLRQRLRPSQVLDLGPWKINLPTGNKQVTQPELGTFADDAFRVVSAAQFTVSCGDSPQPGSDYPRSELREMNRDGGTASWSTTSGDHLLRLTERVTHLPVVKPQLICAQIHTETDYLVLVELNGRRLYVRNRDKVAAVLDTRYELGTFFDLELHAAGGFVDVRYNGVSKARFEVRKDTCYFKAGCYLQSSTSTGDLPTAYGQVEISELVVRHR
ncbi:MAG: polysaccharide lyase family 7 protein [Actinomycetota bacterium]|nr:polysaccharide lyase family 7 protein [Actinomycetota bacterium]